MIRAIIFDFFDVFRSDGYNRWLTEHGYKREGDFLTASERHDRGTYSDQQFFQAISAISGEPVEIIEHEMEHGNTLNEPLVNFVRSIQGHYKIALLSNSSSAYLRNELKKYDLTKYFDEIVISSEVGLIKPEPKVFQHLLNKLSLEPGECAFIDDNPRHVAAANLLGIHGIIFSNVSSLKRDLNKLHRHNNKETFVSKKSKT